MERDDLRRAMRRQKRAMTLSQIQYASARLTQLLTATPQFINAKTVYGYLSCNQEVRTEAILKRALAEGKQVAVPKICGREMRFITITDLNAVKIGKYDIPEPISDAPVANDPTALVIVPGLAFDREGNRLGYGGGYYDRFLSAEPEHPTVGLCYDFQLVDAIRAQAHDVPVQLVLWA